MKNKGFCLGILILVIVCLVAGLLAYLGYVRARSNILRPLVLIHNPLNHERLTVGDGVIVQSTIRAQGGVARAELWVDGLLVAAKKQPDGQAVSPLVFSAGWQPETIGSHVIVVRAFSINGAEGQSSLSVESLPATATQTYTIKEGETLESIAAGLGVPIDELAAMNPSTSTGNVAAGSTLVIPGDSQLNPPAESDDEAAEPAAPVSSGDPPLPDSSAPGSAEDVAEGLGLPDGLHFQMTGIPRSLRVEILGLRTGSAYEGLHCYVGLGDGLPRWLPDADGDPETDESFTSLGGGAWDVAGHLSGAAAPVVQWRSDQAIPIDIACVGLTGGGLDALELGRIALNVEPASWDGAIHTAETSGPEGNFRIEYRIGPADPAPHGEPIWLDIGMTPPTDLQFQPRGFGLYWQYRPRADEEPIDGFRIYLNGTLLWTEPATARLTNLPREWLYPPCGESYTFTVTAYRQAFPDGPESPPSNAVSRDANPENCQRVVVVTFQNLNTHELGSDGHYEHRSGDVGAAYGYFYANSQQASFDGRSDTWGGLGLSDNSQVAIDRLTNRENWQGSGPAQFRIELADAESLVLGYHIMDEDTGYNHPDQLICEGEIVFLPGDIDSSHDGTIASRDGRCEVSYTFHLTSNSPVAVPGAPLPLPSLVVQTLDTQDGFVRTTVLNSGTASWPDRALKVSYTRPGGEVISTVSNESFNLRPNETADLLSQQSADEMGLPVCVTLDPENEVAEIGESTGAISHGPVCMTFPDLVVTDSRYNSDTRQLEVTVQNIGENILNDRAVHVGLRIGSENRLVAEGVENVTLERNATTVIAVPDGGARAQMQSDGYTVSVDEGNHIYEANEENNIYQVPGQMQIRVKWVEFRAPYDYRNAVLYFDVYVGSAGSGPARHLVQWTMPTDGNWSDGNSMGDFPQRWVMADHDEGFDTGWFEINGDEHMTIIATIRPSRSTDPATGMEIFTIANQYGSGPWDAYRACWGLFERPFNSNSGRYLWYFYPEIRGFDLPWTVSFNICRGAAE